MVITSTTLDTGFQNVRRVSNFQVWNIFTFLENKPNDFLYANKVQTLGFPMISLSILH